MKKYLKYFVVLFFALAVVVVQLVALLVRGELPGLRVEADAPGLDAGYLSMLSRMAGVVSYTEGDTDSAELLVFDRPLVASYAGTLASGSAEGQANGQAPAGPFDPALDELRDRAISGLSTVLGFKCLSGTENRRLVDELAVWTGLAPAAWVGSFVDDLSSTDVPADTRSDWESAEGRAWDLAGPGILLRSIIDNHVAVLRRGVELDDRFLVVQGELAGIPVRSLVGSRFLISPEPAATQGAAGVATLLTGQFGLKPAGRRMLETHGIPESFPLLTERRYGAGRVWALALDVFVPASLRSGLTLYPAPRLNALRTLDEPGDGHARVTRITVPIWRAFNLAVLDKRTDKKDTMKPADKASRVISEFRSGNRYLEKRDPDGDWQRWFVKGVNLGPATPGHWFGDPPTDEGTYLAWFDGMRATGFDSLRVYTLLPPAFYRAFVSWNSASEQPLYLIQEIWPEEEVPGGDLGSAEYLSAYFHESDMTIDALYGRADIAERPYRAWGTYRADVSPWLAAVLVGRELLPEEVLATAAARPQEQFSGDWFITGPGHPVESVLARMAERAASRIAATGNRQVPIGFVSWPTLDTMYHPAEWKAGIAGGKADGKADAPYHDRASVDFTAIKKTVRNEAGFFAAFHIYPNYPDFMFRSAEYEISGAVAASLSVEERGYRRYAGYVEALTKTLPGVPLLVAEFGLATGFGTAHRHPEGLDHGGLTESAQAAGIVGMYKAMAERGATGGIVFQWADEWAKKTWTTETYMIPFDRNPLWHNAIDPEQNYGIMAWQTEPIAQRVADTGLTAWSDPSFLYVQVALPAQSLTSGSSTLRMGLDVVPGKTGEFRLSTAGPLAPQGSEFLVKVEFLEGKLVEATLLAQADYNRGGGKLYPRYSEAGGFTRILNLVNARAVTPDGRIFPSAWEDGSVLPVGPGGLAEIQPDGAVLFRLPWSRLNASDPSERRILLDAIRDSRAVLAHDALKTAVIDDIGIWAYTVSATGIPEVFLPARDREFRVPLAGWEDVQASQQPKAAHGVLAEFLGNWNLPLEQ